MQYTLQQKFSAGLCEDGWGCNMETPSAELCVCATECKQHMEYNINTFVRRPQ